MSNDKAVSVDIRIPTPLRNYTDGKSTVVAEARTVGEALDKLVERHPDLRSQLYNEEGKLRSFVNVFRNDDDIRHLDQEATELRARDEVSIIPSIAGGA